MCNQDKMCKKCSGASQSNPFIGQTPYVNPSVNGFDGFAQLAQSNSADGSTPTTASTKDNSITSWLKTILPVVDKVAGVNPTPDTPSDAYSYDVNKPDTTSSTNTVLWVVAGVVLLLVIVYAVVKMRKK